MWVDPRTNWFFQLQKKSHSEWTPDEFQECLKYYDDRIAQAHKNGRKEWIKDKKELLETMNKLGIEPYPQEETISLSENKSIENAVSITQKNKNKIMYIEYKGGDLAGQGRIGLVKFSKTGKTIYYNGKSLQSLKGGGYKANYFDIDTLEKYWISGCKKRGDDTLYPAIIEIDEEVREEYWTHIRKRPDLVNQTSFRSEGKYSKRKPK